MELALTVTMRPREDDGSGLWRQEDHSIVINAVVDGRKVGRCITSGSTDDEGRLLDVVSQVGDVLAQATGTQRPSINL